MKNIKIAYKSGEQIRVLKGTKTDWGHGVKVRVIYSDDSTGWEHISDLFEADGCTNINL